MESPVNVRTSYREISPSGRHTVPKRKVQRAGRVGCCSVRFPCLTTPAPTSEGRPPPPKRKRDESPETLSRWRKDSQQFAPWHWQCRAHALAEEKGKLGTPSSSVREFLHDFPEGYTKSAPERSRCKQLGNSWHLPTSRFLMFVILLAAKVVEVTSQHTRQWYDDKPFPHVRASISPGRAATVSSGHARGGHEVAASGIRTSPNRSSHRSFGRREVPCRLVNIAGLGRSLPRQREPMPRVRLPAAGADGTQFDPVEKRGRQRHRKVSSTRSRTSKSNGCRPRHATFRKYTSRARPSSS